VRFRETCSSQASTRKQEGSILDGGPDNRRDFTILEYSSTVLYIFLIPVPGYPPPGASIGGRIKG